MNINISMGNIAQNRLFSGGMLKSTQEKKSRKQECDNKIAFYENSISALKDVECSSLEDVNRKLELFHSYKDGIDAAKFEYNHHQMFHVLDEARERAEKIAEAAEKMKPKTAEERKEELAEEARGTEEEGGELSKIIDMVEEMNEELLESVEEASEEAVGETAEEITDQVEEVTAGATENVGMGAATKKGKAPVYKRIDYYV